MSRSSGLGAIMNMGLAVIGLAASRGIYDDYLYDDYYANRNKPKPNIIHATEEDLFAKSQIKNGLSKRQKRRLR